MVMINPRLGFRRLAVVMAMAASGHVGASSEPSGVEYALRWNPQDGGPGTAEAVFRLLGMTAGIPEHYEVRYYDLTRPGSAPAQATVILRERKKSGGKTQFRLKYRLSEPLTQSFQCPPGNDFQVGSEVDVTWLAANAQKRVYAYFCTTQAKQPPASLHATPKPCSARMSRYTAQGLKVETWQMPDGGRQLEVSRNTTHNDAAFQDFQAIAVRLIGQGAKPTDESKTELGSRCP
jgi:hypothetical protein